MKTQRKKFLVSSLFPASLICILSALVLTACGGGSSSGDSPQPGQTPAETRAVLTEFLKPEASGEVVFQDGKTTIDASNTKDGYIMVKYNDPDAKILVQVMDPNEFICNYFLKPGDFETFPLPAGRGTYSVTILQNTTDNLYALLYSAEVEVEKIDDFKPFLYPNQYVWYEKGDNCIDLAAKLSSESADDIAFLTNVYHYVIKNISYDYDKAETVETGYVPVCDDTLESGKGICFDYASLMAAMLRSQGIPTKLVMGYSGTVYHAWISVYLAEIGWVDRVIQFDGANWSLMDPTLAASNDRHSVSEYISDGTNYVEKYSY